MDRRIANCCLVTERFSAPDKREEAKALAGQTCFRINRLLPVPYPADVKCPLRDGFLHRTGERRAVPQPVCIPASVRSRSTHIVASPGVGKSELLLNMFLQDIGSGKGAVFIDVHGDAVKRVRSLIPLRL